MAAEKKLATQLGSQRHTLDGLRNGVEIVKSGILGEIKEVHSWVGSSRGLPEPLGAPSECPKTLNWDLWLGPCADRPYVAKLAPYDWRFWWDLAQAKPATGVVIFWTFRSGHLTFNIRLKFAAQALHLIRCVRLSRCTPFWNIQRQTSVVQ